MNSGHIWFLFSDKQSVAVVDNHLKKMSLEALDKNSAT